MDCCICSPVSMFRPPRNTICVTCFEGAKNLLSTLNKPEIQIKGLANDDSKPSLITKTLMNVWRKVEAMKDSSDDLNEKIEFLGGLVGSLKDQIHTDIVLKPGNDEPPIPAHKALMAVRSEIFKNMLESDGCKLAAEGAVAVPEMSHRELECLLEFLYSGALPEEKMKEHVYSLAIAADKYNIPYLRKICERHMTGALSISNALNVLEVSDLCSYQDLKSTALKFIVKNMQEIAFSTAYESFALKNPYLCVQITRASFEDRIQTISSEEALDKIVSLDIARAF